MHESCSQHPASPVSPHCIVQVPLERWDVENAAMNRLDGRLPTRFAAFMKGTPCAFGLGSSRVSTEAKPHTEAQPRAEVEQSYVACAGVSDFDASLFRISSAEAAAMDAQQRLLLELGHEVISAAAPPGSKAKVHHPNLLARCWQGSPVCKRLRLRISYTSLPMTSSFDRSAFRKHRSLQNAICEGCFAGRRYNGEHGSVCRHQLQRVRPAASCAGQLCEHLHRHWRQSQCSGRYADLQHIQLHCHSAHEGFNALHCQQSARSAALSEYLARGETASM